MIIRLYLVPGDEKHSPAARFYVEDLPESKLDAYRAALDGVRFDRARRARVVPLDILPGVLRRLREAELSVEVMPDLLGEMRARSIQEWFDHQAVRARVLAVDKEIIERTKKSKSGNVQKLFDYQVSGAVWLAPRKGALLADEMGLGKSRTVIVAMPANAPMMIVCPAKIKGSDVWKNEFAICRPNVSVMNLAGRKSFRWPRVGECLVLNYDILPPVHDPPCTGHKPPKPCPGCKRSTTELVQTRKGLEFKILGHEEKCDGYLDPEPCPGCAVILKSVPPNMVLVGDEIHKAKEFKAEQTKRFRAIAAAVREVPGGRTWGVTGTPIENHPKDLWSLYVALGIAEEAFGDWDTFTHLFSGQKTTFGWRWDMPDADDTEEVAARNRRVMLRRHDRDVWKDKPPKIFEEINVEIDAFTLRECSKALDEAGGEKAYEKLLESEEELLEKALPKFKHMAAMRARLATAKIPKMLEIVEEWEEKGEPLIVFCNHRAPLDLLAERPGWGALVGGIDAKKVGETVAKFQRGELKGVACSTRAASEGITLTRSTAMLFVDRDWTPSKNKQAEARFHRRGQTRGVRVMILKANHPLDARLTEISLRKQLYMEFGVDSAAVNDASKNESLEASIRAVKEEFSSGSAVRRKAETVKEEEALSALHESRFSDVVDARLAVDLGEEACLLGLTESQWELAKQLAARGKRREVDVSPTTEEKAAS